MPPWERPERTIAISYLAGQSPSAVVYDNQRYVFWSDDDRQPWWTSYDGSSWTPSTQVGNYQVQGAPAGAALAEGVTVTRSFFVGILPQVIGVGTDY